MSHAVSRVADVNEATRDPRAVDAPVLAADRIHALDILRGMALCGMILVHFHQFMASDARSAVEGVIPWGVRVLVEEKAHGIFALLFGMGFAVQLRRLDARGRPVVAIYLRRLMALAAFGFVAEVGFGFSILVGYALWGVALLFVRRWPTRRLLVLALASACAWGVVIEATSLHMLWTSAAPATRAGQSLYQVMHEARQHGSYTALVSARWAVFRLYVDWRTLVPNTDLALFVLGLLAVRHRVIEEPKRHLRLIRAAMLFGALSWIASLMAVLLQPYLSKSMPMQGIEYPILWVFGLVQNQWLCLTYAGAIVLLLAYRDRWTPRLSFFGVAGRMALTNYMLQVAILDVLGSGYGFGVKLRPFAYAPCAVLLFGSQVALSRAWLAYFQFGPLEWLWRSVTYARWQPLARPPAVAASPVVA